MFFLFFFAPQVQPSIGAVNPRETVTATKKVSLLCEVVMGNPPPTIEWYRDGLLMNFEVGRHRLEDGRLVIESVLVSDAGRYTCIATNEVGNASVTTQLIVQGMSVSFAILYCPRLPPSLPPTPPPPPHHPLHYLYPKKLLGFHSSLIILLLCGLICCYHLY